MTEPRTYAPHTLKKPLYDGDQDTPFTMCYKKLRRHQRSDKQYVFDVQPTEAKDGEEPGQATITIKAIVCKHCKQAMTAKTSAESSPL